MLDNKQLIGGGCSGFLITDNEALEERVSLDARGATSLCYRVRIDGKEYFMKQLRPELKSDRRYRSVYRKEYEVGSGIRSQYVVGYEALGENADGPYLLMEHVNGCTLDEKLTTEPEYFSHGRNFEKLLVQLLRGLKALHEAHVAYLDLKPENVMLTQVNNDAKIIDLGFCLADGYSYTAGCSHEYAAPELQEGALKMVDTRTDIYAVGRLMQYVKETACVEVNRHLQHIIDRCTQPDKRKRYADVDEVLRALAGKGLWTAWWRKGRP